MDCNDPELKKAKKDLLKQGYSRTHRVFEVLFVVIVLPLFPIAFFNLIFHFTFWNFPFMCCSALLGILVADFMSGLVHWAADTWGNLDWPLVGKTYIRSFREHHIAPTAMCEHDFFETNGDNFMLVFIPFLYLAIFKDYSSVPDGWELFLSMFWLTTYTGVALTNQFHKWSHTIKPPHFVTVLQHYRIILPKSNHTLHHRPAFDGFYCITTGWLNPVLDHDIIKFWRKAETVVQWLTGLTPREDDWKWTGLLNDTPDAVKNYLKNLNSS